MPALRGARDLVEAREYARTVARAGARHARRGGRPTLERFRELRAGANGDLDRDAARAIVRELKAVGGDLQRVRLALTGRERGPELWRCSPRCRARRRCGGSMRLYNTLTPRARPLPAPPGPIRMYFCGPTVYARAHIGNARPYILGMWLRSLAADAAATT